MTTIPSAGRPANDAEMVATGVLVDRKTARQAVKSSFLGTSAEWYDYFLYGSAAAIVFPHVFFAEMGSTVGTLTSLASFGVAFFFRPLGGLIFGQIGDRVSRKFALVATLLMIGIGTLSYRMSAPIDADRCGGADYPGNSTDHPRNCARR